jgi:hypothetical protein
MNNSKQRSLLEAVNSIVNKPSNDAIYAQLSEAICYSLQAFEDKMGVELTEEQEKLLTQIGFDQCINRPTIKQIDLSEDVHTLINENTPEEVFSCIMEEVLLELAPLLLGLLGIGGGAAAGGAAAGGLGAAALRAGTMAAAGEVGRRVGKIGEKEVGENGIVKKKTLGEAAAPSPSTTPTTKLPPSVTQPAPLAPKGNTPGQQPEEEEEEEPRYQQDPYNPYSLSAQLTAQSMSDVRNPIQESVVKHKKKLFKITFMDKGMKKKGTAVSHKGVMRIVSGKSNFKVYDEKNHDVTSQFRGAPKK